MKTTIKITALLLFVILVGSGKTTLAVEKTKKFNQSWPAAGVENVNISNKFGDVRFKNDGGTNISIDVIVTVEAPTENKANSLLDMVNVTFGKSGSTVKAETNITGNINSRARFSIDYVVNLPPDKNLWVANKYGNLIINQLSGNGDFDVQYGNITAVSLKGANTRLNLAYGKGNINETGNLESNISYSNITFGQTSDLKLNSKYSAVDIDKAKIINTVSRYDKLNFGEIISLSGDTKYSQVKIGKLSKSLQIGSGYGGIRVERIEPGFETVNITNSYGNVFLGMSGLNYTVDARCDYCGISYPQEQFKGNRMKENTSIQIQGKVGSGNGGNLTVKSRYGEIKLDQ